MTKFEVSLEHKTPMKRLWKNFGYSRTYTTKDFINRVLYNLSQKRCKPLQ